MKNFFKRFRCKHKNQRTITNIGGDMINMIDARSVRECKDCGKIIFSLYLDETCKKVNEFYRDKEDKDDTL